MPETAGGYTHWCLLDLTSHMFPRLSMMSIDASMNHYQPSCPNNIIICVPMDQHDLIGNMIDAACVSMIDMDGLCCIHGLALQIPNLMCVLISEN